MGLEAWSDRDGSDKFFDEVENYLTERKLSVLGILTTFKSEKKKKKKRELLFVTDKNTIGADVEQRLFDGLANSPQLDLKETDKLGTPKEPEHTRVWEQGNTDANRKVIAPLVKSLLEGTGGQS
ncbi:Exopolyphosphatase [Tulasnella sp. 427]|nr:Exopolyphosphatase [Tulasnella sp. 427]